MSFKYINPGYNVGALKSMVQYADKKFIGGFYLYKTCTLPLPANTKNIYLRYKMYNGHNTNPASQIAIYLQDASGGRNCGFRTYRDGEETAYINGVQTYQQTEQESNYQVVYMKAVSDANEGILEVYIDGLLVYTYSGNVMGGDDFSQVSLTLNNTKFNGIGEIIISDEYFPPSEKIIALPVANTTTDMTDNGDGSYTATAEGQTLMQTIDTAQLLTQIGEGNTLTGFALIGNPAYYDGDGLSRLATMRGSTEKENVALPTDTNGKILSSWSDNVLQTDFANLSLGWKAKA